MVEIGMFAYVPCQNAPFSQLFGIENIISMSLFNWTAPVPRAHADPSNSHIKVIKLISSLRDSQTSTIIDP
jgi:hypothetical protein